MKVALNDKELPKALPTELAGLDDVQPGYLGATPPKSQPPARGVRAWVDRPEQLRHAVNVLAKAPVVAVDAEFAQPRSRPTASGENASSTPRLALLQLAIDGQCFVVDALRLSDLSPLKAVIENPEIIILLHGAGADLRVIAERGLNVAHYCDLEATSRSIFGQQESSLAAMLQRALNVHLDKSLQRTDWTRRPLPPAMVAYAARDAEMTLALYYWLAQHFPPALKLHEHVNEPEPPVADWIEPFLYGTSPVSPEVAIAEAKARGKLNDAQIYADMRAALVTLVRPMLRNRLLRLIADLSLIELAPEIIPLLQVATAEERASAARTLGRLGYKEGKEAITPLLHDSVYDVRKAAQTALRNLTNHKETRKQKAMPTKLSDGTRRWVIGEPETEESGSTGEENDWKARLRSMMGGD